MVGEVYSTINPGIPCEPQEQNNTKPRVLLRQNYLSEFATDAEKQKAIEHLGLDTINWESLVGTIPEDSEVYNELKRCINLAITSQLTLESLEELKNKLNAYDQHLELPRYTKQELTDLFDSIKNRVSELETYVNDATFRDIINDLKSFIVNYDNLKIGDKQATLSNIVSSLNNLSQISTQLQGLLDSGISVDLINELIDKLDKFQGDAYITNITITSGEETINLQNSTEGESPKFNIEGVDGITTTITGNTINLAIDDTVATKTDLETSEKTIKTFIDDSNFATKNSVIAISDLEDSNSTISQKISSIAQDAITDSVTKVSEAQEASETAKNAAETAKNAAKESADSAATVVANQPKFAAYTEEEYNSLTSKDESTFYFIYTES